LKPILDKKRTVFAVASLFLFAVIVRGAWLAHERGGVFLEQARPINYDEAEYDALARQIASGEGYIQTTNQQGKREIAQTGRPTAFRTPGFPLLLAAVYSISGGDHEFARVVLVIITGLTASCLYLLCLFLFERQPIALLTGLSWIFLPTSIRMSGWLYGEGTAALVLVVALLVVVFAERMSSRTLALLSGFLLGFAILMRGFLLFVPIAPASWLFMRKSRVHAVLLLLGASVCPGIWIARNAVTLGVLTMSTETSEVLWLGNNAWARGSWPGDWPPQHAYLLQKYADFDLLDEVGVYRVFSREAFNEVSQHPRRVIWLLPRKALIFFSPVSWLGTDWLYAVLLFFSFVGSAVLWFRRDCRHYLLLVGLPIICALIISLVSYGDVRHRHPIDPLIAILGVLGISHVPHQLIVRWMSLRG
jgi:4-amino-4-deoxy-L-arabinose transferase-like glycosyltransferase